MFKPEIRHSKFLLAIHHSEMTACGHSDLLCSHSHITSASDLSFPRKERKGKYPVRSSLIDIHKELFPEGGRFREQQ